MFNLHLLCLKRSGQFIKSHLDKMFVKSEGCLNLKTPHYYKGNTIGQGIGLICMLFEILPRFIK